MGSSSNDAGAQDATVDASVDAGVDADAGHGDATADADAGSDAPVDAPADTTQGDASEASLDAQDSGDASACSINPLQTSWDVTADFSTTTNPCGVWTYGYTRSLGSTPFIVYATAETLGTELVAWIDPNNVTTNDPTVYKNLSGTTQNSLPPGQVAEHPGPNGEYSTSRWTAPRAGTYSFSVTFNVGDAINGTSKDAAVLHGTTVLFEQATSANPIYSTTLTMAAGDTFAVAVGITGSETYWYGTTPITFVVTQN